MPPTPQDDKVLLLFSLLSFLFLWVCVSVSVHAKGHWGYIQQKKVCCALSLPTSSLLLSPVGTGTVFSYFSFSSLLFSTTMFFWLAFPTQPAPTYRAFAPASLSNQVGGVVGFQGLFPPSTTLFFPNTKYVCRDEVVVVMEEGEGLDFIMLVFCKPFKKRSL